jgi:hypothetical protein
VRVCVVNPPVYDFSAYDFWVRPYGALQAAGYLAGAAEVRLFDYLDRFHPSAPARQGEPESYGRGKYRAEIVRKPAVFSSLRRHYRRYGLPRRLFREYLRSNGPFDAILIQTGMTYWYPGVQEVVADVKQWCPKAKTILGGTYATLCRHHAHSLGADLVISGTDLRPLWEALGVVPDPAGLPPWNLYPDLQTGALKISDGCPFRCTYCSVPLTQPRFRGRPPGRALAELDWLLECGAREVVFYDDALLFDSESVLQPFLEAVLKGRRRINFHTPNALNARLLSPHLADLMVSAGFKTFYLGLESDSWIWQSKRGRKVYPEEFARAVGALLAAGADPSGICAYLLLGHPGAGEQEVERSMRFVRTQGIRIMLAEFSPIPGTVDGEQCRELVDLEEPLCHNKTWFPIKLLGETEVQRLKHLCVELNNQLKGKAKDSKDNKDCKDCKDCKDNI